MAGETSRKRRYGVWRTADVAEPERYAYFREAVCEAFMDLSPEHEQAGPFDAVVESIPPRGRRGEPGLRHAAPRAPFPGADRPVLRAVLFPQPPARIRMRH